MNGAISVLLRNNSGDSVVRHRSEQYVSAAESLCSLEVRLDSTPRPSRLQGTALPCARRAKEPKWFSFGARGIGRGGRGDWESSGFAPFWRNCRCGC